MEFYLQEIEKALDCKLYYMALLSTLTLPDICGALQSSNGKATGEKYKNWYDTYAKESGSLALTGADCYYFRCAMAHQATTQHPRSHYNRIFFLAPNSVLTLHNCVLDDAFGFDINIFCKNMISAVRKWENDIKDDSNFKRNYDKLIRVYPNGLSPYISGLPIIG